MMVVLRSVYCLVFRHVKLPFCQTLVPGNYSCWKLKLKILQCKTLACV